MTVRVLLDYLWKLKAFFFFFNTKRYKTVLKPQASLKFVNWIMQVKNLEPTETELKLKVSEDPSGRK